MVKGVIVREVKVTEADTDMLGHVNNAVYLRWLVEAATQASAENEWPQKRYFETGITWVVRQHWIEYLRQCLPGDELKIVTWVSKLAGRTSLRRYMVLRGGKICCNAATEWNLVDLRTRRAIDIPDWLAEHFEIVPDDDPRLKDLAGSVRPMRYIPLCLS